MPTPFVAELLRHTDTTLRDGAHLARLAQEIAAREIVPGGPYASVPGGKEDLGTNLAVSLFLARQGIHLPNVDAFIAHALKHGPMLRDSDLNDLIARYTELERDAVSNFETSTPDEVAIHSQILDLAHARLNDLPAGFSKDALRVIDRTIAGNPDKQMSLMAYYIRQALGSKGASISDRHVAELGLANVFFWTAFIIYDDFWDEDEAAEPRLLPVANLFARHYTDYFANLEPGREVAFRSFFHTTMDALDAANRWEMEYCRLSRVGNVITIPEELPAYGDFSMKFHPAAGHVLGPVALLLEAGCTLDSSDTEALKDYFAHYLIAMQLNDDAHDWKEDLARGHISTAVFLLLSVWKERYPEEQTIDVISDQDRLEELFWFDTLVPLCKLVLDRTQRSREALASVSVIEDPGPLEAFITRNERIAEKALREQRGSAAFLAELDA